MKASQLFSWRTSPDLRYPRCTEKTIWRYVSDNVPAGYNLEFKKFFDQYERRMQTAEFAALQQVFDDRMWMQNG